MLRKTEIVLAACLLVFAADHAFARGGRGGGGGGRGGGAGVARSGGGGMSRAPSMSRAAAPRPSVPASRPQVSRPSGSRPNVGAGGAGSISRGAASNAGRGTFNSAASRANAGQAASGRNAFQSQSNFSRPSQSQVNDFLGMPRQTSSSWNTRSTTGDLGGTRSYTTQGGTTITVGGGSGSRTTAGGATIGAGGVGVKVEGSGGNTFVKGTGAIGATNGTNSAIAAGSATGIRGANGGSAANVRGGYADTAGNRAVGGVTAGQNRAGYTAVNARGARTNGTFTQAGGISAVRGPAGNTVAAGRGGAFVNGQFVGGRTWGAVNGNFTHWNAFGPGWYAGYPGAWWPGKWALATTAWATAGWALAGGYCDCYGEPVYYDYGESVYSDGENVYYDDQPVATNEAYYDQASTIADAGASTTNEEWLPLGVFGIVSEGQTQADKVLQLALNKEGAIRGNFQDLTTGQVTPVVGSVDKESQRVAIKLEGNDRFLLETGLYNLTNDEAPALLYLGKDQPETRTLIRLDQPQGDNAEAPAQQ